MSSLRLQHLRDNVSALEKHLLPAQFSPIADYSEPERVDMHARAFRIMAHAEIESYFEDRVTEIAKAAGKAWKEKKHLCRPILHLIAFSGKQMVVPPDTLACPGDTKESVWDARLDPQDRVKECVANFVSKVTTVNHGVREYNLLSMLLPIGLTGQDLDPMFVTELDNFGSMRGEVAHKSNAQGHVSKFVDPKDELERVNSILQNIEPIDSILDAMLAETSVQIP